MNANTNLDAIYAPSQDVVCRELKRELIIVPLVSGIGDMEDELFTLNESGRAIWGRLDGKRSLKDVIEELSAEFEVPTAQLQRDLIELVEELLRRRMVIEVSGV
ncbi:PqqD family protein [Chloroflexota bacterium]